MIRTTIRRAGLLVATTALAGAAFAGTAAATDDTNAGNTEKAGQFVQQCPAGTDVDILNLGGQASGPNCLASADAL